MIMIKISNKNLWLWSESKTFEKRFEASKQQIKVFMKIKHSAQLTQLTKYDLSFCIQYFNKIFWVKFLPCIIVWKGTSCPHATVGRNKSSLAVIKDTAKIFCYRSKIFTINCKLICWFILKYYSFLWLLSYG